MERDVKLILDGDTAGSHVEILVWHQVMLNASPYFQSLLLPGRFAEGNRLARDGKVDIPLPDTNAQAMRVVCDIFHLRHDEISISDITSSLLLDIAVIADKFDCGKALQLWFQRWMEQDHVRGELEEIRRSIERVAVQELSKWIFICQVLDYPSLADVFVSALIKYHNIDALTQEDDLGLGHLSLLFIGMEMQQIMMCGPADLIHMTDKMKDMQTRAITCFYAVMLEFAELVEQGDSCRFSSVADTEDRPQDQWGDYADHDIAAKHFHCSSITFGNFFLAASTELGSSWRSLTSWTGTIDGTYRKMQQVARRLTGPAQIAQSSSPWRRKNVETHESCSLRKSFSERVEDTMQMLDIHITRRPVTEVTENDGGSRLDT